MKPSILQVTPEMVEKANRNLVEAKKEGKSAVRKVRFFGKEVTVEVKMNAVSTCVVKHG